MITVRLGSNVDCQWHWGAKHMAVRDYWDIEAHEYQKGERSTRCTLHNTHKIGAGFVIYALFEGGDAMIS